MDGNAAWKGGRARCRAERGTGIGSGDEEGRRITRRLADRESGEESRPARLRSAFHERNAPATAARPCGTPAVPAATHVAAPRRNRTSRAAPSARFRGRASSKIPLCFETSPSGGKALLQNRVDGVVRGVRLCSGLSGNIRCHKVSPCSTRARGSMYPRPARLRPCAAQPHKGSAPRNITSAPRPPPCRMTMRRGLVAPGSLRSRLRRSRYFSTLFCNRAFMRKGLTCFAVAAIRQTR